MNRTIEVLVGGLAIYKTDMKKHKTARWHKAHQHVPVLAHLGELLIGVIVLAAAQNFWAVLVGANPDITPPSIPTSLALTGRSATEIDISWAASTDDVGVTGYHVFRNAAQIATTVDPNYSDLSLTPNTSYVYTISAFDAATNESAQSSGLTAATLADTSPPSVPGNLHQTGQTTSSISIAWNASSDNVGVTGYDVYRNGALVRSQPGTTYTDTGLAVYTGYVYTIAAHDAANNGSNLSATLNAGTAPDTTAPSVPDNLRKTSSTVSSISLAWDAATDDVGVTGYHVYRSGTLIASVGGTSYTDSGLNVSSSYTYTVQAYDAASNNSAQSAPYNTTSSNDTTAPTIPSSVHATSTLDTSISIAWTASTDDVAVTGYKVYRGGSLLGTTTSTSYDDTGLTPVTQYDYTIKAYDAAANDSAVSAAFSDTTAYDTTAPTIPANLQSSAITDTTISLSWSAATDNVAVTGYDLYRGNAIITTTTGTNFTDTGLGVNTSYTYRIRAHDGSNNNSAQSSPVTISTIPDTVAPATPAGLASPSATTTSIDLTWNAATDDASPSSAISYNLYRNGVLLVTQSGTSYTDTGLRYNTMYHYTVSATDAAVNESPKSAVVDVATLPDTTAPVVAITGPGNGQSLQLTFAINATASDDLDLRRVEFYVDSTLISTVAAAPFGLNWNSYAVHNGAHTITAKAIDGSGNFSSQSVSIAINNPPPPITGDLNGDHKVNIYDLSILLSHFNKPGTGDFNNNGKVDIFDLSTLLARFGNDNSSYQ
jgi:chitodextrinase